MTFVTGAEARAAAARKAMPAGRAALCKTHRINVRVDEEVLRAAKLLVKVDAAKGRVGRRGRWNLTALFDEALREYVDKASRGEVSSDY